MKLNELIPNLKEILDTYHNIDIKWNGGSVKFGHSLSYNEYIIAPNNCSSKFIKYYKRYKNFEKEVLTWNILDNDITFLSYGSKGLNNLKVIIGE